MRATHLRDLLLVVGSTVLTLLLIVIHIPEAEAFTNPDHFRTTMSDRLRGIYARLDLDVIDLESEFIRDHSGTEAFHAFYYVREDGSAGHLSGAGHRRIADLIEQRLATP